MCRFSLCSYMLFQQNTLSICFSDKFCDILRHCFLKQLPTMEINCISRYKEIFGNLDTAETS